MATQWGRKETVVWPPKSPIYTWGAAFIALMCTCAFLWGRFTFGQSALQQFYTPAYVRSTAGAMFKKHDKYRLLYVGNGGKVTRVARTEDVTEGATPTSDGKELPIALSQSASAQGLRTLGKGPETAYQDVPFQAYLKTAVFEGKNLPEIYGSMLGYGLITFLLQLPFSVPRDLKRRKMLKYGRRLKGPVMMTPKEFNKAVEGQGLGLKTTEAKERMRIPTRAEAQHILLMGDTGTGKTTLIMQILMQIEERGDAAIVYDPACEFVQRFYRKDRGDIILNPLDDRCPYWGPAEELRRKAEARAIAASLYQPTNDKKGEFFTETPQKIFAHLLTFGPSPQDLIRWMSDPAEIDERVANTELAQIIAKGAQQQRSGVLASLGLIADSLRMLPTKEEKGSKTWSATEWAEKREGWIFITSRPTEREALRPLHSLWIDLLVMRLMSAPLPGQKKVWFVLDELASLQRLPQLHTAITENRKSNNPLVLGLQGKAQAESIYGHIAEVMLSQPKTKLFLRTTEPKAAEWVSNAIGKVEIERMKETHFDGSRGGRNYSLDRQVEPLVMDSEISGLEDKHAFLKIENSVARFQFEYLHVPATSPDFIPRKVQEDELTFDPKTLRSKVKTQAVAAPAEVEPLPTEEAPPSAEPAGPDLEKTKPLPAASVLTEAEEPQQEEPAPGAEKQPTTSEQMPLLCTPEADGEDEAMLFPDSEPDTPPCEEVEDDADIAEPSFSVGAL